MACIHEDELGSQHLLKVKQPSEDSEFVTDVWLADQLQMAVATIRSQRFKRLHELDHWLDLTPVYIGSKPRYRRSEALAWIQCRGQTRDI
jgi:hypothetical protein